MIIKSQTQKAMSDDDRLSIATILVKLGYKVQITTIRSNGKPIKVVEFLEPNSKVSDIIKDAGGFET